MTQSTQNSPIAPALVRVPFHGEELPAVDLAGERFLPIRPYCDRLGLDVRSQLRKLSAAAWACVVNMTMQLPGDAQGRAVACIPLRALPMWLASINPRKVSAELRPALELYQAQATEVLYRHFLGAVAPAAPVAVEGGPVLAALEGQVEALAALVAAQGAELAALRERLALVLPVATPRRRSPRPAALSPEEHRTLMAQVVDLVRRSPGLAGANAAQEHLQRRRRWVGAAVRELLAAGVLVNRGSAARPRLFCADSAPALEARHA